VKRYIDEMDVKPRRRIVRRSPAAASTFSYAQVETALARAYEAEHVQRGAFRGRLKHFRKLGIPKQQPGKGSRIRYTKVDALFLMLACELAEFGIDPHLITDTLQRQWPLMLRLLQAINPTERSLGNDLYIAISPRLMSWSWNQGKSRATAMEIAAIETALKIAASTVGEPVRIMFFKASQSEALLEELQKGRQRFCVFNLSARVRTVEQALKSGAGAIDECT
jgi:hypothetical protein